MGGHNYNFPESTDDNTKADSKLSELRDESEDITTSNANKKRQKHKEKSSVKKFIKTSHVGKNLTLTKAVQNKGSQELFGPQGTINFEFVYLLML